MGRLGFVVAGDVNASAPSEISLGWRMNPEDG